MKMLGKLVGVQSLNKNPGDEYDATGSMLRHGRAWMWKSAESMDRIWDMEWVLLDHAMGFGLHLDDEGVSAHVRTPLASLFLGTDLGAGLADRLKAALGLERHGGVDVVRMSVTEGMVLWSFLYSDGSWRSDTPWWRNGSIDVADVLLGRPAYTTEDLSSETVNIPMPEGTYRWDVTMQRHMWKRPRWFAKRVLGYAAEARDGNHIPIPGKGENSWDCGADALHSQHGRGARDVAEAVAKVVEGVLRTRMRYGGSYHYPDGGRHDAKKAAAGD